VGVDEGVQRLVAFAIALGLPGADGAALLEAGDNAFGGQLAEVVGIEAAGEVDGAGAGFGQFQAGVDGILHSIDADDEQRNLALVGAGWSTRPYGDARPTPPLDCPDATRQSRAAELVDGLGVVTAGIDANSTDWHMITATALGVGGVQGQIKISPKHAAPPGSPHYHTIVDDPGLLVTAHADHLEFNSVTLNVDAGS